MLACCFKALVYSRLALFPSFCRRQQFSYLAVLFYNQKHILTPIRKSMLDVPRLNAVCISFPYIFSTRYFHSMFQYVEILIHTFKAIQMLSTQGDFGERLPAITRSFRFKITCVVNLLTYFVHFVQPLFCFNKKNSFLSYY